MTDVHTKEVVCKHIATLLDQNFSIEYIADANFDLLCEEEAKAEIVALEKKWKVEHDVLQRTIDEMQAVRRF